MTNHDHVEHLRGTIKILRRADRWRLRKRNREAVKELRTLLRLATRCSMETDSRR